MGRIEHYSFGSITVDGCRYFKDLIIYPDRVQSPWWRDQGHKLQPEDVPEVLENPPDVIVVGQGESGKMQVDPRLEEALRVLNVQMVALFTQDACNSFNALSERGENVVAALHLTC